MGIYTSSKKSSQGMLAFWNPCVNTYTTHKLVTKLRGSSVISGTMGTSHKS